MPDSDFVKQFKPLKLVIGAVAILIGLGMLSHVLFSDVIHLKLLLGGALAIVLGGFALLNPFETACARCKKSLDSVRSHLGAESDRAEMESAMRGADAQRVLQILETSTVPATPGIGDTRYVLELEFCKTCHHTARANLVRTTYGDNAGSTKEESLVPWQPLSSELTARIVERMYARNQEQQVAQFSQYTGAAS